jgi:hypothetical protein
MVSTSTPIYTSTKEASQVVLKTLEASKEASQAFYYSKLNPQATSNVEAS